MMSFNTCSILWTVLFCFGLPSGVFRQHIQKETVGGKTYAVIYADSLAGDRPMGKRSNDDAGGHYHPASGFQGNGANLSVNDRIPFRFIVASEDVGNNDESGW
ncbi:hypothetical protein SFC43_15460 [Bacteroides sp. CR5/BHMF/2]|nr:hypothetical protein [Bacteroides sp. CR5/BHMF/2]